MTIASPNIERQLIYITRWLIVALVVAGVVAVSSYNSKEAVRRRVVAAVKVVDQLKLQNAELKNAFYVALDTRELMSVAGRLGYVRDSRPHHLTFRSDGSATQDGPVVSFSRESIR